MNKKTIKLLATTGLVGLWGMFFALTGPSCPPVIAWPLFFAVFTGTLCWCEQYGGDFMKGIFGDEN